MNQRATPTASSRNQQSSQSQIAGSLSELGIETDLPKHHAFAVESVRLATFNNWPSDIRQKPADLAKAGFFYIGQADSVKCYWCDGGLRNWDANDDPWVEHTRWFPKCGHVKRAKGLRFIERIKSQQQSTSAASSSTVAPQAQGHVLRDIDPREITGRMDTPIVKSVLDMGFDKKFVQNIIEYQLRTSRDDFAQSEDLLEMCLQFSDNPPSNFPLPPLEPAAANRAPVEPPVPQEQEMEIATTSKDKKKKENESTGNVECKICMDAEVNVVFLPCGHLVCCSSCAPALKNCPICRGLIRGTVNAILS